MNRMMEALALVDLYECQGDYIFGRSLWKGTASLAGLADEK